MKLERSAGPMKPSLELALERVRALLHEERSSGASRVRIGDRLVRSPCLKRELRTVT
jgi:hypothetical protein